MSIYSDTSNGILHLRPNQDADFSMAKELRERLAIAANDDIDYVILDFSLSTLVSSATLHTILDAARQVQKRHGCIVIAGASQQFHSLLVMSDMLKVVPAFQSTKEAQAYILESLSETDSFFDQEDDET